MVHLVRGAVIWTALLVPWMPGIAAAQATFNPQADWNGTYGFASTADRNLRLLQSDLIRKNEEGYYESLGKVTVNNNVINSNNNSGNSSTVNDIGQQQTTIGVVSTATNNIDLTNSGGAIVDTRNLATTAGCVDSNISIDVGPTASGCK
ncbi:hypothetical protein [Aureimonas flava]|uniref:hypothetical protein n=1 Tax=Aureimonas flava TaxID=2320271 RepID=UPI001459FD72|nr:hypothetical protein [Aureimonas flava]